MEYLDFVLRLDAGDAGGLIVRLVASPAGQAEAPFTPPVVAPEVERAAEDFERLVETSRDGDILRDVRPRSQSASGERQKRLGDQLFRALFPEPIRDRYYESLGHLGPHQGLRIKLQMRLGDPRLAVVHSLPWECLYRAEDETFLGRERRTSITRHLDLPLPGARPLLPLPLRVLVVAAQPRGFRPLPHLERERRALEDLGRRRSGIEVVPLARPTLGDLREALLSGGFHVLHFLGHGGFVAATGEGLLYLEDGTGGAAPVSGPLLADHLRGVTSLRLAVLNACQTAQAAAPGPFGGVATALLQAGLPAVVAMQFPITDRAASAFSEAFYRRLTAGDPVDAAVSEGRLRIRRDLPESAEWATPALFLRAPDGRIFESRHAVWKPWAAAAGVFLVLATGLVLIPDREDEPVQEETAAAPVEEKELRPTEPSPQVEPTAPPPSHGIQETGDRPNPPLIEGGMTAASPPPAKPDRTPTEEPRATATYTLLDGHPVFVGKMDAYLTANFKLYGDVPFVSLVLAPVAAKEVIRPVMGTENVEFKTEQGTYWIRVLAIDEGRRTMTVLPGSIDR